MKRIFITASFILSIISSAFAGDYHNQAIRQKSGGSVTLTCAQCHTMHGTQGGNSFSLIYDGTLARYAKLLRMETVVKLCEYCHDEDPASLGAPDLFDLLPAYNASAGNYNTVLNPVNKAKQHDIGVDLTGISPPGYSGSEWDNAQTKYGPVFSCIYCHDQHGNRYYRNLRPEPLFPNDRDPIGLAGAKVTYNNGAWDNTSSIAQAVTAPSGDQFKTSNMTYRKHDDGTKIIQIARFCGKCHEDFYGEGGDPKMGGSPNGDNGINTQWKRHPVGGISVGIGNGHTDPDHFASFTGINRVRVINPDGVDSGGDEQPFCLTCHRVHGSANHSNLIFGAPTVLGGNGTKMRDTCQQCHNQ